jgi:hypothetical protein
MTTTGIDVPRIIDELERIADEFDHTGHTAAAAKIRVAVATVRSYLYPSCPDCQDRGWFEDGICGCSAGRVYIDKIDAQHERTIKSVIDASGFAS